jgi:type I restriction-modification system DNA methylase subunit
MFHALGWDFENINEVSPEEHASNGRVDYAIKLNGVSQFYIEAKSLKADLNREDYVKQAVSYSYARGVTWAILTDFESLRVFYALKSTPFISLSCADYIKNFDDIYLFSKQATIENELTQKAQAYGAIPPFIPIEKRLFKQLSLWRENLFNEIYRYNEDKKLQREQVDSMIQKLFNRLIFMRTAEDRGIEEKGLRALLNQWKTSGSKGYLIKSLRVLFNDYDGYYDSELFSHHLLDEDIFIDSESLQPVLEGLYEIPGSLISYNFNDIDADVLGAVYEQYLGHVAEAVKQRVKDAQARMSLGYETPTYALTDKKERRKEQGIYYTPKYFTDYIVKETVGKFLQENAGYPDKLKNIKILDPACGSGSFLIRAYDELLKYHADELKKPLHDLDQWERLPILTNSIFGVDLDKQAIKVARLNLLLRSLAHREPLPYLGNNIKNGNSLISGTEEELKKYFGDSWKDKNAFNWQGEFKDVMKNGGFDVVIGNPPYGAEFDENDRAFIADYYPHSKDNKNSAMVFIEKGLALLKEGGYFGFIVPKSLAYSQRWVNGRKLILEKLGSACDASKAFKEVLLEQMVIIISQKFTARPHYESMLLNNGINNEKVSILKTVAASTDTIPLGISSKALTIFTKMTAVNIFMKDISKTSRGLPFQKYIIQDSNGTPVYRGDHISRYCLHVSSDKLNNDALSKADTKVTFLKQPKILSQRIVAHVLKPTEHIIIMSTYDKEGGTYS